MGTISRYLTVAVAGIGASIVIMVPVPPVLAATMVPTDVQQPGTQPGEVLLEAAPGMKMSFTSPASCQGCHDSSLGSQDRELYPHYGWSGSMMAHAGRDPMFWAALAVTEQDFLPGANPATRGGAGDLCLRCHAVNGWLSGRSTPTDGSGLTSTPQQNDTNGVECEFCHQLVHPDQRVNVTGTREVYRPPFEPFDALTGEAYLGSAQYVINGARSSFGPYLGPYRDATPPHLFLQSFDAIAARSFHRQGELCGTCHDVSNPAVGDLAHNNGAQVPLEPGTFSGMLGSPIEGKAAFNNPPYKYGVLERTSSEWTASALDTLLVNDFETLPEDLQVQGGALYNAYHRAFDVRSNADYADGERRYFTCQTCHMSAATGVGCTSGRVRGDLPRHDLTGSGIL